MKEYIRNFVIIAHIDHGKSTLADRFLELTGAVEKRKMKEQYLDQMDLERERGITIKMQPVRMRWNVGVLECWNEKNKTFPTSERSERSNKRSDQAFILNLIDTPGHVDFSYEVSRALAAVEGAILLVDGTQGIQAQTLSNFEIAKKQGLKIIPAINKIDLDIPDLESLKKSLSDLTGVSVAHLVSAKTGQGVEELLKEVVKIVPPAEGSTEKPFRALIFDSHYDTHKGVVAHIRVVDGRIKARVNCLLMSRNFDFEALEVGYFLPAMEKAEQLEAGEIGYLATGIKQAGLIRIGDTITENPKSKVQNPKLLEVQPLAGYKEPQPMVFAGIYPETADDYDLLKNSILKLKLNDAALSYESSYQEGLGRGFTCGFLGLLHFEIVLERLKREYNLSLTSTAPSVLYKIILKNNAEKLIYKISEMPNSSEIKEIKEPWINLEIVMPKDCLGLILTLANKNRMLYKATETIGDKLRLVFEAPMPEVIYNFYDKLKSVSAGYASMSYSILDWRPGDLIKLDILVAGEIIPSLSKIVHKNRVESEARASVKKLKEFLPRENFNVALQAAVDSRIIARETMPALKKDVTGYLYGGDRTRKMKLWQKQKKGKKKLKELGRGSVNIPPDVFLKMLS